jgi:hypothetical protein
LRNKSIIISRRQPCSSFAVHFRDSFFFPFDLLLFLHLLHPFMMTKTSFPPLSDPPISKQEHNNPLFSACSSVRSARTKLQRWYKKGGVPRTDQVFYGRISAGYTSQRLALKTYKKERDIFDYKAMLKASAHCVIRGAIDVDAVSSIRSNLVPYMDSPDGWSTSVQFSEQVFQKPILFKSYALSDFGLRSGSSINNLPFLSIWLLGVVRISFPYFKFASLFLIKNNCKSTTWADDPVFHTDMPPNWTGDTSGLDSRPDAPLVFWFPLDRDVTLAYKQHTNKSNPPPKITASLLHLKPTDLLLFDRNTFLHRSSKPIYPKFSNFRVLINLSTNVDELIY